MPLGFGRVALKSRGRPLSVMAHLKKSIVEVKAEENCLANALLIAIARVDNDANYKGYRQVRKKRPVFQALLKETGIDMTSGGGFSNRFQEHFRDYKIVVYQGLGCDDIMYEGQVDSSKHLNLFYDDVERHYHVITTLQLQWLKSTYVMHVIKAVGVI